MDLQPALGGELAQAVGTRVIVKLVNSRVGSLPWRTMSTGHGHKLNLGKNEMDEENWLATNLLLATSAFFKHCWSSTDQRAKMILKENTFNLAELFGLYSRLCTLRRCSINFLPFNLSPQSTQVRASLSSSSSMWARISPT